MNKNIEAAISRSPLSSDLRKVELHVFAEIIIRECLYIADKESKEQSTDLGKQVADEIWYKIKNHFLV